MNLFAGHSTPKVTSNPAWYRSRIAAIGKLLEEVPQSEDRNSPRALLRNGLIPKELEKRFNQLQDNEYKLTFALNETLSFREMTSYNTWFAMHPEKICGKEIITTSLQFPITVKGTKEDIINAINNGESDDRDAETSTENQVIEDETPHTNHFGDAKRLLEWPVCDFHSYYKDEMTKFNQEHKSLDEEIQSLEQQIIDAGQDRKKRKELFEKFKAANLERSLAWRAFENDWLDFCMDLQKIIVEKARSQGIVISEDDDNIIPGEVLMAITDRPGIELNWKTPIGEVIDKELEYYKNISDTNSESHSSELELEALALEVELQLLKT